MFSTNDVFDDAVKGSSIYVDEEKRSSSSMTSKVVATLLLTGIVYVGLNFYNTSKVNKSIESSLIVKNELVAEIQKKSEALVVAKVNDSEQDYLNALRMIEDELTQEREVLEIDTKEQLDLSLAMNNLLEDEALASTSDADSYTKALSQEISSHKMETVVADNTDYTEELKNEIGLLLKESKKIQTIVVKKGDTLESISSEFYGDAANYKRIIASNENVNNATDLIYEGQTLILPY